MKRWMRRIMAGLLAAVTWMTLAAPCTAETVLYDYPAKDDDTIQSPSALMMYMGVSPSQDVILYEKNADKPYEPGALIRVAMLGYAAELIKANKLDMDKDTAAYSLELFNHYVAGTGLTVALMEFGEAWKLRDLMTVCAIQTAADCAVVLAERLSGSVEAFVDGLNEYADRLGCTNSHFTNVIGLNEAGQQMTARDTAVFLRHAMENSEVAAMFELTSWAVKPVSGGSTRSWATSNDMIRQSTDYYYTYALGGRTGGTLTESSLVEYGHKDGYEYLAVVMGAPRKDKDGNLTGTGYADARRLMRWGFLDFNYVTLLRANEPVGRLPVRDSAGHSEVALVPVTALATVVKSGLDINTVTRKLIPDKSYVKAPVKKGDALGTMELYLEGKLLGTVKLVAAESAPYSLSYAVWSRIRAVIFSGWFLAFLGLLLLMVAGYLIFAVRYNRKRRKSMKK